MNAEPAPVVYADGPDAPLPDPGVIAAVVGRPVELLLGWVVRTPPWLGDGDSSAGITTLMVGAGLRRAVGSGRVEYVATRLSAFTGLLAGRLRPAVAVVGAYETPGGWRLAGSPGWAAAAAVAATDGVVIERWDRSPGQGGIAEGPALPPCRVVEVIDRTDPPDDLPDNRYGPEHAAIGRLVAELIPDGATIQWGPGAIGAAVVGALSRPVRVRSGLVTEELVDLDRRGLLAEPAVAAYLWGGPDLHAMAGSGRLVLTDIGHTHDLTAISAIPRFVAVNTAIQVGLDGAVNVESARGRIVAGPGGHPDFAAGACRSPGGISVVALTATSGPDGARSNIVARPDVVSTPRSDVDVVVTEYGVADLRGVPDRQRAERLIAVAAPRHREALAAASR